MSGELSVGLDHLRPKTRPLFAECRLARSQGRLASFSRVDPGERALNPLPAARVVLDDHADEDDGQHDPRRREDAVQFGDVVVMIDRLGRRSAGHRVRC